MEIDLHSASMLLVPALNCVFFRIHGKKRVLGEKQKRLYPFLCCAVLAIEAGLAVFYPARVNGIETMTSHSVSLLALFLYPGAAGRLPAASVSMMFVVKFIITGNHWCLLNACSALAIVFTTHLYSKFVLEGRKPGALHIASVVLVLQVLFYILYMVIGADNISEILVYVGKTAPVTEASDVILCALAVWTDNMAQYGVKRPPRRVETPISVTVRRYLIIAFAAALVVSNVLTFRVQNRIAEKQTDTLLNLALVEVSDDIMLIEAEGGDVGAYADLIAENRKVGRSGHIFIFNSDTYAVVGCPEDYSKEELNAEVSKIEYELLSEDGVTYSVTINGGRFFCQGIEAQTYYIVAALPHAEALQGRNAAMYMNMFFEVLIFAGLYLEMYIIIRKVVLRHLSKLGQTLNRVAEGRLDTRADERSSAEFAKLSDDINTTVATLNGYIDEASRRIDRELEMAATIQTSVLPGLGEVLSDRSDYEIYACMDTAKEVGGDFYDFYYSGENTLNFMIADVSGKGIPAAMFMMRAKAELKNNAQSRTELDKVFARVNESLAVNNEADMFVTAWQGRLSLIDGSVTYVSAGHNPPLIIRAGGETGFIQTENDLMLAGIEGAGYTLRTMTLNPGDTVYLYTDGVTEAMNENGEQYTPKRLKALLETRGDLTPEEMCALVRADVAEFTRGARVSDDITMLALKYRGRP